MSERAAESVPRLEDGRRLHHLGRGYFVLLGADNREASERAEGSVWVGFPKSGLQTIVVMLPDSTNGDGLVELTAREATRRLGMGLEGDGIIQESWLSGHARTGAPVLVEWRDGLAHMA